MVQHSILRLFITTKPHGDVTPYDLSIWNSAENHKDKGLRRVSTPTNLPRNGKFSVENFLRSISTRETKRNGNRTENNISKLLIFFIKKKRNVFIDEKY